MKTLVLVIATIGLSLGVCLAQTPDIVAEQVECDKVTGTVCPDGKTAPGACPMTMRVKTWPKEKLEHCAAVDEAFEKLQESVRQEDAKRIQKQQNNVLMRITPHRKGY